jgi:hypothetical protein
MADADIAALDSRVTALERTVPDGLKRIEDLIRQEIHDLKREQIGDIKIAITRVETDTKSTLDRIERTLEKEIERIADDQRRLWEAVAVLQASNSQRTGGSKTLDRVWNIVGIMFGAAAAIGGSYLSAGRSPHP